MKHSENMNSCNQIFNTRFVDQVPLEWPLKNIEKKQWNFVNCSLLGNLSAH
jgi:hypothetical protein